MGPRGSSRRKGSLPGPTSTKRAAPSGEAESERLLTDQTLLATLDGFVNAVKKSRARSRASTKVDAVVSV